MTLCINDKRKGFLVVRSHVEPQNERIAINFHAPLQELGTRQNAEADSTVGARVRPFGRPSQTFCLLDSIVGRCAASGCTCLVL